MLTTEDRVHYGKSTKVERYQWTLQDRPGVMMAIPKNVLRVDEEYQRGQNEGKVMSIARDWSWVACGTLIVGDREGAFFVVDGQHRLLAARRRTDITEMPCIVFQTTTVQQEAKGFLAANTQRKPITSIDRFRAMVCTDDEAALFVKRLLDDAGREATAAAGPKSVRCLTTLLSLAKTNKQRLERLWPLILQLSENQPVLQQIVMGLIDLESRMPSDESLMDGKWRTRLLEIGSDRLIKAANEAAAYYARGGAKVWGEGMSRVLNKGLRHKLNAYAETTE